MCVEYPAKKTAGDPVLHRGVKMGVAQFEADLEKSVRTLSSFHHGLRVRDSGCHGLLAHHGLPCLECRDCQFPVRIVGRGNKDQPDRRIPQYVVEGSRRLHAELLLQLLHSLSITIEDGDAANHGALLERLQDISAHIPTA